MKNCFVKNVCLFLSVDVQGNGDGDDDSRRDVLLRIQQLEEMNKQLGGMEMVPAGGEEVSMMMWMARIGAIIYLFFSVGGDSES